MPINTIAYATMFQQELDKQIVAKAVTGFMEGNASLVSYQGGKTVKVPKLSMDGLGNYDRDAGFKKGSATLEFESFVMGQDRATSFSLDAQDVNESNFVATASNLMGEFQRTKVIPEVDAYRISKIAALAIAKGGNCVTGGYTPAKADILTQIRADIAAVQDVIGVGVPLLVMLSIATQNVLENSTEITKQLHVGASCMKDGTMTTGSDISLEVTMLDKCPLIEVPSALMKTAFAFADGSTNFGFAPVDSAKVTIGGVTYSAASVGPAGNGYSVTIVQGVADAAVATGVVDAAGNLVITLGTTTGAVPVVMTATAAAALVLSGAGSALITKAVTGTAGAVQVATAKTSLSGGAGTGAAAKNINWIVMAQDTAIAVCKTDTMRIFDPIANQGANAWKLDYRKYHDLFILDNKYVTLKVNIKEAL